MGTGFCPPPLVWIGLKKKKDMSLFGFPNVCSYFRKINNPQKSSYLSYVMSWEIRNNKRWEKRGLEILGKSHLITYFFNKESFRYLSLKIMNSKHIWMSILCLWSRIPVRYTLGWHCAASNPTPSDYTRKMTLMSRLKQKV